MELHNLLLTAVLMDDVKRTGASVSCSVDIPLDARKKDLAVCSGDFYLLHLSIL
jgi:hypothetical protein